MNAETITVTIRTRPHNVFDFVSNVDNLLTWAPAFADSISDQEGKWVARKGENTFELRIASDKHFGIVDFQVIPSPGVVAVAPSRVVPNGPDTEYIFTLFQAPEMTDQVFEQTIQSMSHEFETLRKLLEQNA